MNAGIGLVGWAFPQVGVAIRATYLGNTVYKTTKVAYRLFTGDVVGAAVDMAANQVGACEEILNKCLAQNVFGIANPAPANPGDFQIKGGLAIMCWTQYGVCQFAKWWANR